MDLSLRSREVATAEGGVAATVLAVGGELDVHSAPQLGERITEILGGGARRLVVDLNDIEFIDSTGLGVLVGGLNEARAAEGRLDLACSVERVLRLLQITDLDAVFAVFPTADEALAASV